MRAGTGGDVEQRAPPGGAVVRDRRLGEVAQAVHLVQDLEVGPALGRAVDAEVGVEVAVLVLGRGEQLGQVVELVGERRIGPGRQAPRRRLHPLVDVGVGVVAPVEGSFDQAGGAPEVVQRAGRLALALLGGQ